MKCSAIDDCFNRLIFFPFTHKGFYELFLAYFSFQMQVHYTARFADGIVFDSSYKRARPLTMRIGVGKVLIKCSVQSLKVHVSLKSLSNLFKSVATALGAMVLIERTEWWKNIYLRLLLTESIYALFSFK